LCGHYRAWELTFRLERRIDDHAHVLRHRWAGVGNHDLKKRALLHVGLDVGPHVGLRLCFSDFPL
jgi:hypothetical protein